MQSTDSQKAEGQRLIDWSGIRAAAVTIGVREAGRQASSHLPKEEQNRFVERVMKRSQREGWITHVNSLTAQPNDKEKPLSANVRTGSNAILQHLIQAKDKSRTNLAKYVLNGSKVAARSRSPLSDAGKVKDLAAVMEKVWPEEKQDVHNDLHIGVLAQHANIQVLNRQADA